MLGQMDTHLKYLGHSIKCMILSFISYFSNFISGGHHISFSLCSYDNKIMTFFIL